MAEVLDKSTYDMNEAKAAREGVQPDIMNELLCHDIWRGSLAIV